ncbi:hypothetical protein Tco_0805144, partial [Tanacetum coccineum]
GSLPLITYETVIKEWEDRMEMAATTACSLVAEQDSVLVYAARHSLIAARHKLMLLGITYYCWFWATAKAKTVNKEHHIQALVDKKKVIINEKSVRSDLMLEDVEGIECLLNDVIFKQLTLMVLRLQSGMNLVALWHLLSFVFSQTKNLTFPMFLDKQVKGMSKHNGIYVTPSHTTDMGEDSTAPTDSHSTPIITQPSSSKPQKKKSRRKQRKDIGPTKPIPDVATNEEPTSTPSCDPPQSGEDRLQLANLMTLCTNLKKQVLDLEEAKIAQAKEIDSLKKRVK